MIILHNNRHKERKALLILIQPGDLLMHVENLEMDKWLKWVLFIKVNGQITSDTL